jgi:hypothetical protein
MFGGGSRDVWVEELSVAPQSNTEMYADSGQVRPREVC